MILSWCVVKPEVALPALLHLILALFSYTDYIIMGYIIYDNV